jgi:GR25 family glycosyltransferase involved in LPS biosynthesis
MYDPASDYIRLPLWVLEINWFGEDPAKIVNPRPLPLEDCLRVPTAAELAEKKKFCAFVATNPRCQNRNLAFHILNEWRGVDAGGRLFCNLPSGPVPAGLGGGGGELAKVDFYRNYKYVIAYENSASPGYVTEKILHAKAAGCVPIYWGDKFVDRDFEAKGFLNANTCETAEDLRRLVTKLEEEEGAWASMAAVPALSAYKRHWCERTMEEIVKVVVRRVLSKDIQFAEGAWSSPVGQETQGPHATQQQRRLVTAANAPYIASALLLVQTAKRYEPVTTEMVCYVWPDVTAEHRGALKSAGATVLDLPAGEAFGWPAAADFWNPQHFAWKLWILQEEAQRSERGTHVLYMDAGIEAVRSLEPLWKTIAEKGHLFIEDPEQVNRTWCHPTFCKELAVTEEELAAQQLWAGCLGFRTDSAASLSVVKAAWEIASQKREVIVGHKWQPYSEICKGHRHDQSILSVLTHRQTCARVPLATVYCDRARRTAEMRGVPLYVHRGKPKILQPLLPAIDDGYVINLERRKDRLVSFRSNKDVADIHVIPAVDGRTLELTPELAGLFRNNDFKWKKSVMGCALSHVALWQRLAQDTVAKSYVIFEDDVRLKADWAAQWYKAAAHVPADADAIYLGGVLPPNKAALPAITEPVNPFFARVAKNTLFSTPGAAPRRYFHFCNYAYVLTQQGARKLCQLIQERGIFTSGDHMIVNHGDSYLNIYFTTPLLADCIQEEDPVYQRSDFNNFARLDTFDSDLWNNNEHFSQAELTEALAVEMRKIDIRVVKEPLSEAERQKLEEEHARKMGACVSTSVSTGSGPEAAAPKEDVGKSRTDKMNKEEKLRLWNDFLRAVAQKKSDAVKRGLDAIFESWQVAEDIIADMSWFRIFEQLVLTDNEELKHHRDQIVGFIHRRGGVGAPAWSSIVRHWGLTATREASAATPVFVSNEASTTIFYMRGVDPTTYLETEWYSNIFPRGIRWQEVATLGDLLGAQVRHTPILLYQEPPNRSMVASLQLVLDKCKEVGRQLVLLHMSDEFGRDLVKGLYDHPAVKHVFRNYWRGDLAAFGTDKVTVLPLGYANGRSQPEGAPTPVFADRDLVWSFAGSADRVGRVDFLKQLHGAQPYVEALKEGWSAPHAQDSAAYRSTLLRSKFVPCLRGAKALESFRVYEALEAGAIPVYVPSESNGCADEFREMYGLAHPFLAVPSWSEAAQVLPRLAANPAVMEEHRGRVSSWWSAKKAEVAKKIAGILA